MRDKLSWPVRDTVTIRSSLGQTRKLHVLTWLGPERALAMAAHADGHGPGTPDGIYDIEVEELGPARSDDRGLNSDLYISGMSARRQTDSLCDA